ncbi:hypothetical protein [Paenibacillus nasutitermitis]|uniref:Uncharacterized protein n=1 Tax=Paenibacillus nasutitermitis TaxID=1652958 RepID=A0A917DU76_9BACL|nr:hypothetical protein [Paenibacillus nasutitermitis]GGD71429.1 hypothetical protein GCM10010911_31690 [Paenibacillus nasutitermitis]
MNELIQFISKNFFLVFIIIGFIFSVINKNKKAKPPGGRMPDFGGGPGLPQSQGNQRRDDQSMNSPVEPPPYKNPYDGDGEGVSAEYEEERKFAAPVYVEPPKVRVPARPAAPRRSPLAEQQVPRPARKTNGALLKNLEKDELRRAVVLAEVLGPPRAKRSHRLF